MLRLAALLLALGLALPAHAECYADYKAKRDDPLRLHYGVMAVADDLCGQAGPAGQDVANRIAGDGWQLVKLLGFFGPEGLSERKESAGDFYLRY